jgi:heme exporter protein D
MVMLTILLNVIADDWFNIYDKSSITEYLSYACSITVLGIAFLAAASLRKEKALYIDIREESSLYNCAVFVAVMTSLIALIFVVNQYICEKDEVRNIAQDLIFLFTGVTSIFYLIMERKLLKEGRLVPYYSIVLAIVVPSIICSWVTCSVHTPIALIRKLQKDKKIFSTVNSIRSNIFGYAKTTAENADAQTTPENIDAIIQDMSDIDKANIIQGDIKYTKIDNQKFSLSWKVESDPESLKHKKKLAHEYQKESTSIFNNYVNGRCSDETSLEIPKNKIAELNEDK